MGAVLVRAVKKDEGCAADQGCVAHKENPDRPVRRGRSPGIVVEAFHEKVRSEERSQKRQGEAIAAPDPGPQFPRTLQDRGVQRNERRREKHKTDVADPKPREGQRIAPACIPHGKRQEPGSLGNRQEPVADADPGPLLHEHEDAEAENRYSRGKNAPGMPRERVMSGIHEVYDHSRRSRTGCAGPGSRLCGRRQT